MPKNIPLKIRPGVYKQGTVYEVKGRWYDANLVRWHNGRMGPIGGWDPMVKSASPFYIDVDEPVRGMVAWLANNNQSFLGFGTPTKLYEFHQGVVTAITPVGFTTGGADATITSGNYGDGSYGSGNYGEGDAGITEITEANVWQLDTFGEDMIAQAYSDGKLYAYDRSAGGAAAVIANAPTGCRGVVVTPERFVVALGASGNLPTGAEGDRREVIWSDQEDKDTWEPTSGNQAGSFVLPGAGKLMCGRRSRSETLLWTDVDMYAMRYVGGTLVYSFQQVGSNCGVISRQSAVAVDGKAFWMGHRKFHMYDGFVQDIPCTVSDYVFDDLNRVQASKIFAMTISQFNTVIWFYPSAGSTENDRYVAFNWSTNHWEIGQLERTAGVDRGAFEYPVMTDAGGVVYDHERGTNMKDTDLSTSLVPSAATGPIELGDGDQVMTVVGVIPDEDTLGDVSLKMYSSLYPTGTETLSAAFTAREPTDVLISARQVRLELTQTNPGWKFGTPRLVVEVGGRR